MNDNHQHCEAPDDSFLQVVEQLAEHITSELELLTENAMMPFGVPDAQSLVVVKKLVSDTFSFVRKGNVFVFVDETKITRRAIEKLENLYDTLSNLLDVIDSEALSALISLIASQILYAIAIGSIIAGRSLVDSAHAIADFADMSNGNGRMELDPMVWLLVVLMQQSGIALSIVSDYVMPKANETRASSDSYRRERPSSVQESINDDDSQYNIEELAIKARKTADKNPRLTAEMFAELFREETEGLLDSFWTSLRKSVSKKLLKIAKDIIFGIKSKFSRG